VGIFLLLFLLVNLLLGRVVIRRVQKLARFADQISTGGRDVPELSVQGRDEIADLGKSFDRLRHSLTKAMKLLGKEE
jgi:protein-histidine pros-kinase